MADQAEQQPQFHVNTQSVSIQPLPEFSPDAEIGSSLAAKWKLWMEDFEMFILASGITDPKRKRALLLYQAGQRVREIFRQLQDTGTESDYDTAKTKLQEYFEPQQNRRYAVYQFRQAKQEPEETLDQFNTRLRSLAQTCAFHDVDFEIEQQIITAGTSSRIRKRALRDPSYDLKSILLDGRRAEQSEYQARDIESKEPSTDGRHKVHTTPKRTTTCRIETVAECRNPYHIREKVKTALEDLEKQDIIERVPEDQPTPWVSPIVAVPKKEGGGGGSVYVST